MRRTLSRAADLNDFRLTGGEVDGNQSSGQAVAQIASILGRANLHCVVSALRVGLRTTKRVCQGHFRVISHVIEPNASREETLRIIVDETRGCLREVSEASTDEIGRLRLELGKLQEEAREIVSEPEPEPPAERKYRRGWKAKT